MLIKISLIIILTTTILILVVKKTSHQPSTIHRISTIMSNRLLEAGRVPMNQKEGSAMRKLQQNTLKLVNKLK